jgi:hypothetical protein
MHSGKALSASHEPPGRSGASHSSQARHSAIRASRAGHGGAAGGVHPAGVIQGQGQGRVVGRVHGGWHHSGHALFPTVRGAAPAGPARAFALSLGTTAHTLRERFREDRLGLTASSLTFTTIHGAGALFYRGAGGVHRVPHVRQAAGCAAALAGARAWCPTPLRARCWATSRSSRPRPAGWGCWVWACCCATALALILTIDRTLNNIWRVRPAPAGPARADLLGRHDAGAAAAGRQPGADVVCALGLARAGGAHSGRPALLLDSHGVLCAGRRHGGPVPLCAQHPGELAPRLGGRFVRGGVHGAGQESCWRCTWPRCPPIRRCTAPLPRCPSCWCGSTWPGSSCCWGPWWPPTCPACWRAWRGARATRAGTSSWRWRCCSSSTWPATPRRGACGPMRWRSGCAWMRCSSNRRSMPCWPWTGWGACWPTRKPPRWRRWCSACCWSARWAAAPACEALTQYQCGLSIR